MRRVALRSLAAAAVLLAAGSAPGQAQRPPSGPLARVGIDQNLGAALPLDARFLDERGASVALGDYFSRAAAGRPVVLALVYYRCPMLCSYVLDGARQAFRAMSLSAGKDFDFVAVSIDPVDGPAGARVKREDFLKSYGRAGAGEGVHFLTGEPAAIGRVAGALGFRYEKDSETGEFAHAAAIFVATPEGRISKYFYGVEYAPRDLRLSLVEASSGRVGAPVDRFLLYCSHYDPATGHYTLVVMRIVRLGGLATLAGLAVLLAVFFRRDAARAGRAA
jgi:protein SCO1/2